MENGSRRESLLQLTLKPEATVPGGSGRKSWSVMAREVGLMWVLSKRGSLSLTALLTGLYFPG